ncbi:aldo/keto reductase [Longivirga aurantiaca]|uniref:Aldo/keto reductase n=1 Tax=Longivirga aurantiaca TaxID=1837743 RepID=A0ABW1SYD9_9ACTN
MRTRRLGAELEVSSLGLGCMTMSGTYGTDFDDAESRATLLRAVELGVTLFDTADVYGPFANEALIGHALAGQRDRVLYSTKFGMVRASDGTNLGVNGRPDYVRRSCDLSLQRLGTDRIDIYWQHRLDRDTPIEETVGAMADLVAAGKVRYIGLSEVSGATLRRAHAVHPVAAIQSEYSLQSRDVEQEILPVCRELGVGFVAYGPLGRGLLTGAISHADDLAPDDWRRTSPRFQGDALQRNLALVEASREIADDLGCTLAQLALAWVLAQGDDVVPIPGTKHRRNLESNVAAASLQLTDEHLARLGDLVPPDAVVGDRYSDMSAVNI